MPQHAKPVRPQQPVKRAAKDGAWTEQEALPRRFRGGLEESNRIAARIGLKPLTGPTGPKVAY